jgi:hypothetical protein
MDPSALPTRAADLVDAVREEAPLSPEALARIKANVLAQRPLRRRALPLGLRLALLGGLVLASVATAKGTIVLWRAVVAPAAPRARVTPASSGGHVRSAARAASATPAWSGPSPAPAVAPTAAVLPEPLVERAASPATPASVGTPAQPRPRRVASSPRRGGDEATTEAQILARSLFLLRQQHDARGALAVLDAYASAYPRGVLASEALSARLEAVVQLGDRPAALRLLDDRKSFTGRLGAEQLLTRAELRASAGRYSDALADFDRLLGPLAPSATPGNLERALYGRAVCFGRLGRDDRARVDLEAYRTRYPTGTYAAEVARLLPGASGRP